MIPADVNVIGFTFMFSNNWLLYRHLIDLVGEAFPSAKVIAGGEHISAMPAFCIRQTKHLYACAVGEGEDTAVELFCAIKEHRSLYGIEGIVYRDDNGQPITNKRRSRVRGISELPIAGNCTHDWDKVEAYGKTVRPPLALRKQDPAAVARGAALFGLATATANNAGCVKCHGGAGWTASRVSFPLSTVDPSPLVAQPFTPPVAWAPATSDQGWNFHTTKINTQPSSAFFPGFEATNRAAPNQVACVIRNVGTFGSGALEQRLVNGNLVRAQGRLGYNVPSLYGLAVGAP